MRLSDKNLKLILLISIIFACLISVIWHYDFGFLGGIPFGLRSLTFSLFFNQSLNIDKYWQAAGIDTAYYQGHYFSGYPPGASFLAAIFFFFEQSFCWIIVHIMGPINGIIAWWLESMALSLPTILATSFTAVLIYSLSRFYKLSKKVAFFSGWCYAFTTIIFAYSWQLHYHPIAAFLAFICFYLSLVSNKNYSKRILFLIGAIFGLSFLFEYVAVLYIIPTFGYLWINMKEKKKLLYLLPPFFVFVSLMGLYNFLNFDTPWLFAHNFQEVAYTGETPGVIFTFFSFWRGLLGLYLSLPKGLLFHMPLILLAPLGGYLFYKKDKKAALFLFSSVILVSVVYASWYSWEGGYNYGPRYISSTQPFYIFLIGWSIQKIFIEQKTKIAQVLAMIVVGISVIIANANALLGTRVVFPLEGTLPLWSNPVPIKRTITVISALIRGEQYTFSPFHFRFYKEFPLLSSLDYHSMLAFYLGLLLVFEFLPLFVVIFSREEK